jgi:small acid-soluble spore protein H (minor)
MDIQRAQEIIDSPDHITVTYQGVPVWLESVDTRTYSIHVHLEDDPTKKRTVSVQELREQ